VKIEEFTINDIYVLKELQPPAWSDITVPHKFYQSSNYCTTLKLVEGDSIIGIGSLIKHEDVAWLAHIIIKSERRNKGLGKLITQALIDELKEFKTIYLMATELGEPVYKKLGFEVETEQLFLKYDNFYKTQSEFKNIKSYTEDYKKEILALDYFATGENRKTHLLEFIDESFVYVNEGNFEGFYLPKFSEGLIIAKNSFAGIELVKKRLLTNKEAIVPIDNSFVINFLMSLGFTETRKAKRMRLGEKRVHHQEMVYNRVSGQIG